VNNTGTVSLATNITVADLNINSGTLTAGTRAISAAEINSASTFNAPSTTLTLSGDFNSSGTFNHNNGTLVLTGTTNFSGNPLLNHITINNGATLNGPVLLRLNGNLQNNGQFQTNSAMVRFSGSVIQRVSGTTTTEFFNLDVTNAASPVSLSMDTHANLRGTMTLGNTSTVDGDGTANTSVFTVLSVDDIAGSDGSIGPLAATANVTGNVTVQRYFRAADNTDRFISSPVTNAPVSQLQDDFFVTGNFTGTSFPCSGCTRNGASLNYYNETILGGPFQEGYTRTPGQGSSNAETLVTGRGYDTWMWNGVAATTWDVSGPINRGTVVYTVSHTASTPPEPTIDGWNLLGNPYPSSISWNTDAGWTRTNIDATVWVWDVVGAVWRSYNHATNSGDLTDGIIATGQGFWVQANPGGASLSVNEAAKTSNSGAYLRTSTLPTLQITVSRNGVQDNAFIVVDGKGTKGWDHGLDAVKFAIGIESMSLSVQANTLNLGHYVTNKTEDDMPLSLVAGNGDYIMSFEVSGINAFEGIYLVDKFSRTTVPIRQSHSFTITEDIRSQKDRFILTRNPESYEVLETSEPLIAYYPNPIKDKLYVRVNAQDISTASVLNNLGQTIKTIDLNYDNGTSAGELDMAALPAGVYYLKLGSDHQQFKIQKLIKQ
jgi:hypothetical protein